jgi:carbamoyl-phosphate synthase large subunit
MMSNFSNVLVNSGGKWVGMVLQLRESMQTVEALRAGRIMVASMEVITPAGCFADEAYVVPPIQDSEYIDSLLRICNGKEIRVVVPLIDLDLVRLAPHLDAFKRVGTTVICPEPELVDLCLDKSRFEEFVNIEKIPYPRTFMSDQLKEVEYPLFHKRRRGFGSIGSGVCKSYDEAKTILAKMDDLVWQQYVSSPEVSVDAYISNSGKCIVCVQRIRDKVVAGEAYRSHTVNIPAVRELARRTIEALAKVGLRGPLNAQIFACDPPLLIEVNTRLGSASVFSNVACGGRLLNAVLNEACGGISDGDPDDYIVGMELYRFLGEVFHVGTQVVKISPVR